MKPEFFVICISLPSPAFPVLSQFSILMSVTSQASSSAWINNKIPCMSCGLIKYWAWSDPKVEWFQCGYLKFHLTKRVMGPTYLYLTNICFMFRLQALKDSSHQMHFKTSFHWSMSLGTLTNLRPERWLPWRVWRVWSGYRGSSVYNPVIGKV